MRTSKFTAEQIAQALRRVEGGVAVAEAVTSGSPRPRSAAGSGSSAGSARRSCASCASFGTRTASSSSWWRT